MLSFGLGITDLRGRNTPSNPLTGDASGGTITTYTLNGVTYRVHMFSSSGTLEVTRQIPGARYLLIGGGDGGAGGGGGAGGFVEGTKLLTVGSYPVVVGAGGNGAYGGGAYVPGDTGGDSTFAGLVANGGGGGGATSGEALKGGSVGGSGGGGAYWWGGYNSRRGFNTG